MSLILLAERYATALASAAEDAGALEPVRQDLELLAGAVAESAELVQVLDRPRLPAEGKAAVLRALFRHPPHEVTESFIRLLADRGRAAHLEAIAAACIEAIDEKAGLLTAEVLTAAALTAEQEEALRDRLSSHVGSQVKLNVRLDPALRGGLKVRVADTVFDGTVGAYLEEVHRILSGSSPSAESAKTR